MSQFKLTVADDQGDTVYEKTFEVAGPMEACAKALADAKTADVADLREEFWDLMFEARKPRAPELADRDQRRMVTVKAALAALGVDVGRRPADVPDETKSASERL